MQSIACHLVPPSSAATACMRVGQFARKEVHRRPLEPLKNSDLIVREFLNQKLQLHVAALLRWAAARADHESAKVEYRRRWLKLLHQEPVLPDREQFLRETCEWRIGNTCANSAYSSAPKNHNTSRLTRHTRRNLPSARKRFGVRFEKAVTNLRLTASRYRNRSTTGSG